jgi:hypothetical protein
MPLNEIILDCSSISTTFDSFEQVLQKPRDIISAEMASLGCLIEESNYSADETLYFHYFNIEEQRDIFSKIAFFHLTRTDDHRNFLKRGILPTKLVINQVWNHIASITKANDIKINLRKIRASIEKDTESTYYHKLYVDSDGPYAFLTKETAFNRSCCNHFLDSPEIIVDILREIEERENVKLFKKYKKLTYPYIVKFHAIPKDNVWRYVGAALEYLYWYSVKEETGGLDIGFDGKGKPIAPEHIDKNIKI